ncbi:MAG: alanine--tRNA ligase [bacterium]|nr:alanine--tRNA ligase [bacterium]
MTAEKLRQKYLDFFKAKGHSVIPSASLIPENDPTVLFTTAGMHPLVPYLMGESHPGGSRVASAQKCVRTGDIDEVGDATHHTFFEMLGNWSFGDYFKEEAINWSWEFLTSKRGLNLDKNRLAVSVFAGDADAPFDQEAFDLWKNLGVPEARIAKLPKKNNWWGPAGQTGPCGPDTEIFYWTGDPAETPESFNYDNDSWVEIWNNVFMQYYKNSEGKYEVMERKNVDTGLGLERVIAILNGFCDNYRTDLFSNLIFKLERLSGKKYDQTGEITRAMRLIADHLKAAAMIMGDEKGVPPSNTDQGYVVRRLIRRAIRYGRQIGIAEESWTKEIAKIVIHDYQTAYPELRNNADRVIEQLKAEEAKFKKTLEQGLKEFEKLNQAEIGGQAAFNLYQTYGFPLEMTVELAQEKNKKVDIRGFNHELKKHQDLSRTASAGMFKGGLADAGEQTTKYHTAAHLLLAALREILGDHVIQKGSNITAERLRFDFAHKEKMTDEEKQKVEKTVNQAIQQDLPIICQELPLEQAINSGAHGVFGAKYGERVTVYTIGEAKTYFSKEICGGPHVEHTGVLGRFKIIKEESSSAGVRRIKAVLE